MLFRRALRPVSLLLILASGCDVQPARTRQDPDYREPLIYGWLYKLEFYDGTHYFDRDIQVTDIEGLRMVPIVTLNDRRVAPYYYTPTQYRYGDADSIPVYQPYELQIEHFWGEAFCHLVMPGDFQVTRPDTSYILQMESTLVVTWQRSKGASWYWLDLVADYDYHDRYGDWDSYSAEVSMQVFDTFAVIPPSWLFPSFVAEVQEGDGSAMVWSGDGPAVEPGDIGNIRGSGVGFFNAMSEPRERLFIVGAPPLYRHSPGPAVRRERFLDRLRSRAGN